MWRLSQSLLFRIVLVLVLAAFCLALLMWLRPSYLSEVQVREAIVTTIQSEAPASFYVTGTLSITATSTVESTEYLLPQSFRINIGSTQATVRMPGHVAYGFDIRTLRPDAIQVVGDNIIEVTIPQLRTFSVEPDVEAMQISTSAGGWQRWRGSAEERAEVEEQALRLAHKSLRTQANEHLRSSSQPQINTAHALAGLLKPSLQAMGVSHPQFRFRIGPDLVLEPSG